MGPVGAGVPQLGAAPRPQARRQRVPASRRASPPARWCPHSPAWSPPVGQGGLERILLHPRLPLVAVELAAVFVLHGLR
eukprot:11760672-Alexandrium_andersonii.AAC.1